LRVRPVVENGERQLYGRRREHGFSECDGDRSTRLTARRRVQVRARELGFMACAMTCGNRTESSGISMGARGRTSGGFR
jgi:hypothetical protein